MRKAFGVNIFGLDKVNTFKYLKVVFMHKMAFLEYIPYLLGDIPGFLFIFSLNRLRTSYYCFVVVILAPRIPDLEGLDPSDRKSGSRETLYATN